MREIDKNHLCPSCGVDQAELADALNTSLEYVLWPNGSGGFMGKSNARVRAETIIARCDECLTHFGYKRGG